MSSTRSKSYQFENFVKWLFYAVVFSCTFSCHDSIDLYNRPGFEVGTRPSVNNPVRTAPPGYDQPPAAPIVAQQPQPVAPYVRTAPDYYYYQPYYPQYQRPASRTYNNPYAFQPPAQYPYYDVDQYYTPPAAYNPSVEHENQVAFQGPNNVQKGVSGSTNLMH